MFNKVELGMMRVLTQDCKIEARLGWKNGHAMIDGISPDDAIDALTANMISREKALEFTWTDTARKTTAEQFRNACAQMAGDSRSLGFMAGWACDAVIREGFAVVTRLDMTSGPQKLIRDLRVLAPKITRKHFVSALSGGPYEDQSSFGLDPVAVRTHAYEQKAPTKTKAPGKSGLIWLAFESIPLHPVIPVAANRAQTTGWRSRPDYAYVWPVWKGLLTFTEIEFLRLLPVERLPQRPGVTQIWASRYGKSGKYGMLFPARREH